ncbi:3' exoribonuclease family domain 1-domain-containing protein [Penicillium capsulatum]|nr:3' exoribonuclease family domain 1-domain-containing protein [Penicillium capsulatum]
MPLDTSTTYPLTRLRLDGRRWNELRLLSAQISTNPASSGSSYLSMGNTAIMCSVHGPAEGRRGESSGAAGNAGASVEVDVNIAGFAGVDRKRRAAGNDSIHVSVLSADGSLLAAAINACTLALVDAGIPMPGLLCGCTAGMSGAASTPRDPRHDELDPLLDLSLPEEQELPSLTVGTTTSVPVGENKMDDEEGDMKVAVLTMDSKLHCTYIDTMLAVGIDGCSQIRELLEGVPLNPSFLSSLVVEYNIPSSSIEMDSMTFSSAMATMDMPSAALSSAMPTGTGMSMPDMGDMDMSCKISVSRSSQVGFS